MSTRDTSGGGRDDAVERILRDTLAREADMVQPSDDGLARITERLRADGADAEDGSDYPVRDHRRGGGPGWKPWAAGLVAAAVVGAVAGLLYVNNNDDDPSGVAGTPTATTTQTSTPTTSATESPTSTSTGELEGVPVYWLGESKASVWLYREFRTVPDVGGPVASAVSAMTSMEPQDPDYFTPWAPASRVTVTEDGDAITVDISADAFAGSGVGSQVAERAVQQLVWTATAAAQKPGPVTITVDGEAYDAWGAIRLGEPLSRDADARGQIWIESPTEGATLAEPYRVTGSSTAFEGTISWEVEAPDGSMIGHGFTMGGANGTFADYAFTLDFEGLEPGGPYTLRIWADDMSGGESPEGPRMFEQTRTFDIR